MTNLNSQNLPLETNMESNIIIKNYNSQKKLNIRIYPSMV